MSIISEYIKHASVVFASGNPSNLIASIPIEPSHPFWRSLKPALLNHVPSVSEIVALSSPVSPDAKENFGAFMESVLRNVSAANGDSMGEFKSLVIVLTTANKLYSQTTPDTGHLHAQMNPLILSLCKRLYMLSERAAKASPHPPRHSLSPRSIRDQTRQVVEKSMQVAQSNVQPGLWDEQQANGRALVGDGAWALANLLWRIYAERKLHTQASALGRTFENMRPTEERRLAARGHLIRLTDVCQSYYWRGRLGVVLLDARGAKYWFDKAWSICPSSAFKQRRAILVRLIPVNLLLGSLPTTTLLQTYNLPQFLPLIHAFKTGNIPAWRRELRQNRDWYRARNSWLLLFERGEILVWRNLFRRILKEYYLSNPSAPLNRCPTSVFLNGVRKTFQGSGEAEDGDITLEDIIVATASMVDHVCLPFSCLLVKVQVLMYYRASSLVSSHIQIKTSR
ncbi:hypothetical protein BCR39DRAFT_464718 [Naematelia encephala]|uniref:Uncharacterized protein n=1 Tax=Naematelia encephala TaxID=71784 RepID=A0A1Y2BCV1_9TREE|nr:hypothetical protein BCR39DRAFT_464718 [Naematelia encephala]